MPLARGLNVSLLCPGIRDVCTLKLFLRRRRVPSRFSVSRTSRCCFHSRKHRYGWGIIFTHTGHCSFFSLLRVLLSRNDTPCCLDSENLFLINLSPRGERVLALRGKEFVLITSDPYRSRLIFDISFEWYTTVRSVWDCWMHTRLPWNHCFCWISNRLRYLFLLFLIDSLERCAVS